MAGSLDKFYFVIPSQPIDSWLKYTLDVLIDIRCLPNNLEIVTPDELPPEQACLFYGVRSFDSTKPFIPRTCQQDLSEMSYLDLEVSNNSVPVLVYSNTITSDKEKTKCGFDFDLLFNLFAYVSCLEEYRYERRLGTVHSHAAKLRGDQRRFDRPYGNFLALALRKKLLDHFPGCMVDCKSKATIYLTHDVDAVEKVFPTRIKEGMFLFINGVRNLAGGRWNESFRSILKTSRLLLHKRNYFLFDKICDIENEYGFKSIFNVYARIDGGSIIEKLKGFIFDPQYDIEFHPQLTGKLKHLYNNGREIGAHFAYGTWEDESRMRQEKEKIVAAVGIPDVCSSRQHWFRFSLEKTWRALWEAGIKVDTSLGFTDRLGFRAGFASAFHPYDHDKQMKLPIKVIPTILMDSHLFYYRNLNGVQARREMVSLMDQIDIVQGEVCIIWHTHVFSKDHGWIDCYRQLLELMQKKNLTAGSMALAIEHVQVV